MSEYFEWGGFENVYLEDSYVLSIDEEKAQVSFLVEMVLTEAHAFYTPPAEGEMYCYKLGRIVFDEPASVVWVRKNYQPSYDLEGGGDYGNIDRFSFVSDGYNLSGDWGEVAIKSRPPRLVWSK